MTQITLGVTDHAGQYAELTVELAVAGSDRVPVLPGSDLGVAAAATCPGDTLLLGAGTYQGVTLQHANLEGEGQGMSIIEGGLGLAPRGVPSLSVASLTVIGGVSLDRGGATLRDVEVTNSPGFGFHTYNNPFDILVENSNFHHNQGHGLFFDVASATVRGSTLRSMPMGPCSQRPIASRSARATFTTIAAPACASRT